MVTVVTLITVAGCGGGGAALPPSSQEVGHTDINPQPRENVRDGGDLRLPLDGLPINFNYNEVDGTVADVSNIVGAVVPSWFTGTADGGLVPNHDYLTKAEITSTSPQVVTYTINPRAVWTDGSPITWRDFEAYWRSQNGTNPAYQTSGTTGYQDITSVALGVDDRQVVITFGRPFAEWRNLFNPFYPASVSATPESFNTSLTKGIPVSAGPFVISSVDQGAKTVTLTRNPRWWGTPAKLDRIIFRQVDDSARPDALANNELDYFEFGADVDQLRRAQSSPGVAIRNAPSRYYTHVTFNGAPGAVLADLDMRRAIAQGIDRQAIARRMLGQVVPDARPSGNHIYVPGGKDYRDNAGGLAFDPAAANQALDRLGWVRQGQGRVKDGRQLSLRLVYGQIATNEDVAKTLQNQLGQIGVTLVLLPQAIAELFPNITRGNFDLALFAWGGTASPLSSSVEIYGSPIGNVVRENYGRIASPEIDALFARGIAELDDAKRAAIGNEVDQKIWQEVHSVVLYARPGAVAVRSNLANFGASGFADPDYINAGFVK
ncbi:ABC transporter family substrate-binding protein [Pseudonocardia acaciae]|uniref:ABC transporter family substrate-binding protein n=1 Tax=Pseudonocardia acaciae TaxID=551276 RepID=UPI00056B29BE|nr:ABC transporter family substrate-binding protein [Pseudonocardia acaciae]